MSALPDQTKGSIKVVRSNKAQDLLRWYNVFIDDNDFGRLFAFQTKSFEVEAGNHDVIFRITTGQSQSDRLQLDVRPGESREIRISSRQFLLKDVWALPIAGFLRVGLDRYRPWIIAKVVDR